MSKQRVLQCSHYIDDRFCDLGKEADFYGYCQMCHRYSPQKKKIHKINRKKEVMDKRKKNDFLSKSDWENENETM